MIFLSQRQFKVPKATFICQKDRLQFKQTQVQTYTRRDNAMKEESEKRNAKRPGLRVNKKEKVFREAIFKVIQIF